MIVVDQDKEILINFDNVELITVNDDEPVIVANLVSNTEVELGEYKSKERANEVLQKIIKLYEQDTYYREIPLGNGVYSRKELNHPLPKVFEMPEE